MRVCGFFDFFFIFCRCFSFPPLPGDVKILQVAHCEPELSIELIGLLTGSLGCSETIVKTHVNIL